MHSLLLSLLVGLVSLAGLGEAVVQSQMHFVRTGHFDHYHRYVKFTAASIPTTNCPNPPFGSHVLAYINQETTSTQARIFVDHKMKEIIFAAPGTATAQDWATDNNYTQVPYISPGIHKCAGQCMVHGGFLEAWNSIAEQTHHIMRKAHHHYKDYKMVCTGHSLGAAIATLAWMSLKGEKLPVHAAYTFGQPRTGNQDFANHIDRLAKSSTHRIGSFHRVTHAADPVPNEPGSYDDTWRHPRTELWEAGKYVQNATTTWRCYGQESPYCNLGQQADPDPNDHMLYSNVQLADAYQYCGLG